jgi:murein DD-endopeptidase MepM/ murein hydrolase activator NlpD
MVLPRLAVLVVLAGVLATAPAGAAHGEPPGHWTWPIGAGDSSVVHGFDPPAEPWLAGHRGVDLRGRPGAVVRAAGDGVVAFAGRVAGVGVVSVRHADGLLTTYQPVHPGVQRGESVRAGQPIGRLVLAGSHCLPAACLHWGLRRDSDYLDPLALVGAGRVRLLPLYRPRGPFAPPAPVAAGAVGGLGVAAAAVGRSRRRRPPLSRR